MEVLERLVSDSYPERVAAEAELESWARDAGPTAIDWLVESSLNHDQPEVRDRSLSVLKRIALDRLAKDRPGFVGIRMDPLPVDLEGEASFGVRILSVTPGSPAEAAGLRAGDVVSDLNGTGFDGRVPAHQELLERIAGFRSRAKVRIGFVREGGRREIDLKLAARPWSLGDLGGDRFNPGFADETEARDAVFREWLKAWQAERPPNP